MRIALVSVALALLITVSGGIGARASDNMDVEKERDKFQGVWKLESVEMGGAALPAEQFKDLTMMVDGDTYSFWKGDEIVQVATPKLDLATSPKSRDMKMIDGPNKGVVMLGIYEINGDTLTACYDPEGKKRPTEFKTSPGSRTVLVVQKRVTK